ncbi:MAG TPA: phosphatidate cytidylyltransferase [Gemmatimonadaceae bacterium]|nr:phosphatidate cytidylyltransferase [Gemmatimonadaceae bacterium]
MSNLAARVLFAVVAIPVVLALVYAGGLALALLLAVAGALGSWEYYRIARAAGYTPLEPAGILVALLLPPAVHLYRLGWFDPPVLTLAAVLVLIVFALTIWTRGVDGRPVGAAATTVFGVLYASGMLTFAYGLRYHTYAVGARAGTVLLLYPLALTWISDTAAYFVGRSVGRHKLIPSVSPGKTVEGAVGALVCCAAASWAYARWVLPPLAFLGVHAGTAILIGIVLSAAVQLGDLAESLIKREAGVKDSSHLIPGHGGVLDRLDGMLFALPVAYLLLTYPHVLFPAIR